jgi:type IV pilus assembly protein PilW
MTMKRQRTAFAARPSPEQARQAGFSLVELMVSMLIGLVIIAALVTLFVNTSGNNRELARANSMIENGRFAIKVLEDDLVHAGYWGGLVPMFDDQTSVDPPTDVPTAVPDPCLPYDPDDPPSWPAEYRANLIGIPVQVYDDPAVVGSCVAEGVIDVDDYELGTDLLIVRHAELCLPGEAGSYCEADNPDDFYIQAGFCATEVAPYVFDTSGFTLHKLNCTTVADKRKFVSNLYYVRNYAVTEGDGIPTLVRSRFAPDPVTDIPAYQPPEALVEGVEGFRVELGVDDVSKTGAAVDYGAAVEWEDPLDKVTPTNRGDGVPDGDYVRCDPDCATGALTEDELMNVTSARIYVLARSRETSPNYTDSKTYTLGSAGDMGPFNDNFKRHVFTTTVRLPNVAGRRITP